MAARVDRSRLQDLIEERAVAHDAMDSSRVARVREDMERAEARSVAAALHRVIFRGSVQAAGRRDSPTRAPPVRGHERAGTGP